MASSATSAAVELFVFVKIRQPILTRGFNPAIPTLRNFARQSYLVATAEGQDSSARTLEKWMKWHDSICLEQCRIKHNVRGNSSAAMSFHFEVKDLSNDRVLLTPFSAPIHCLPYFALSSPHPELYAHLNGGPFATLDELMSYVERFETVDPSKLLYAIIDKTRPPSPESPSGALAGLIGFQNASPDNLSIEIGPIIVLPTFQRTHVASNAIGLLLQYALDPKEREGLGLRRVQWDCGSGNKASMRVAERMGFVKEGVLRWQCVHRNGIVRGKVGNGRGIPRGGDLGRDTVIYGLCCDSWEDGGRHTVQAVMDRR